MASSSFYHSQHQLVPRTYGARIIQTCPPLEFSQGTLYVFREILRSRSLSSILSIHSNTGRSMQIREYRADFLSFLSKKIPILKAGASDITIACPINHGRYFLCIGNFHPDNSYNSFGALVVLDGKTLTPLIADSLPSHLLDPLDISLNAKNLQIIMLSFNEGVNVIIDMDKREIQICEAASESLKNSAKEEKTATAIPSASTSEIKRILDEVKPKTPEVKTDQFTSDMVSYLKEFQDQPNNRELVRTLDLSPTDEQSIFSTFYTVNGSKIINIPVRLHNTVIHDLDTLLALPEKNGIRHLSGSDETFLLSDLRPAREIQARIMETIQKKASEAVNSPPGGAPTRRMAPPGGII